MQSPETRARQHLLLQGFTHYTCEAAVALLRVGSLTLLDAAHAWAIEIGPRDRMHTDTLLAAGVPESTVAQALVAAAETCANEGKRGVLAHTLGATLFVELDVSSVRDARVRIEGAVTLGKAPPADRLEAFPDEMIEREAARRAKRRDATRD